MSEPPQDGRRRALDTAARALSRRDHTVAQMRALLERRGVEQADVEAAIAELCETGWLDDARYARRYAEDRRSLERWGPERIELELTRRGVAAPEIEAALAGHDREHQLADAARLLTEKVGRPPEDDRQRDRAWRVLVRRGYEPELAYEAVRAYEREAA